MQSKITIEVDFDNNNEPVIQLLVRSTDDIRDKLLRNFIERLGGQSSWCKIYCAYTNEPFQRWKLFPITEDEFKKEGEAMLEQHRLNLEFKNR